MTYYANFKWESDSIVSEDGYCSDIYIECSGNGEKTIDLILIFKSEDSMELLDPKLIEPKEHERTKERALHELKMKADEPSDKHNDDYYFEYARDLARLENEDL